MPSRHTTPIWQNLKVPHQYQAMITSVEIHQKVCIYTAELKMDESSVGTY